MKNYMLQFWLLRSRALQEPDNAQLFRQLLFYTELCGNYSDCCSLYEEILNRHPYASNAWYNLGLAYQQLGIAEEALEALEYAYIANPYFEEAYRAYAALAFEQGRYRQALQCYQEMQERMESDNSVLLRMSECYLHLGNTQIAKDLCKKSLQLNPYYAEAYFRLGVCFVVEKNYPPAVRWLREAIRKEDGREEFHTVLAEVYSHLGNKQRATHHYWRAIELAPEEPAGWSGLANFLMRAGWPEEALEVLEQATENTTDADFLYGRAACLFLLAKRREGLAVLRKALARNYSGHPALFRWMPALENDLDIRQVIDREGRG